MPEFAHGNGIKYILLEISPWWKYIMLMCALEANHGAIFAQQRALLYYFSAARGECFVCVFGTGAATDCASFVSTRSSSSIQMHNGHTHRANAALNWQHKEKDFSLLLSLSTGLLVCPIQNSTAAGNKVAIFAWLVHKDTNPLCSWHGSAPRLACFRTQQWPFILRACAAEKNTCARGECLRCCGINVQREVLEVCARINYLFCSAASAFFFISAIILISPLEKVDARRSCCLSAQRGMRNAAPSTRELCFPRSQLKDLLSFDCNQSVLFAARAELICDVIARRIQPEIHSRVDLSALLVYNWRVCANNWVVLFCNNRARRRGYVCRVLFDEVFLNHACGSKAF
jgi:hypothetical protein